MTDTFVIAIELEKRLERGVSLCEAFAALDRSFSSKDYRVRLFYFVSAVLLYNIWRLTDFLLKAGVDTEIDYPPILTTGEWCGVGVF